MKSTFARVIFSRDPEFCRSVREDLLSFRSHTDFGFTDFRKLVFRHAYFHDANFLSFVLIQCRLLFSQNIFRSSLAALVTPVTTAAQKSCGNLCLLRGKY